jgi:hypothetical protein
MAELPNPTPALARKIWESMAKPSTRRVATRLRQAGFSISHMRVARWRNRGWRPASREDHPLEVARAALNDAVPLLTSDPTTTAEVFVEQKAAERRSLEQLSDTELLRTAAREVAVALIMISRAVQRRADALIPSKAGELAVLVRSLAASLKALATGFVQVLKMQPPPPVVGESPRASSATETDPLEAAWKAWDNRKRQ